MGRSLSVLLSGLMLALVVTACGGSNGTAPGALATSQAKQPLLSQKATASDYATVVEQLYVAYFGRPADPAGLINFENSLLKLNAPTTITGLAQAYNTNPSIKALIDSFGTSKESQTLYGSGTSQQFVTAIFNNVLSRQPAAAGLAFWADPIDAGTLSKGNVALSIMAGALGNTTTQGLLDAALVNNRINVAIYFSGQVTILNAVSAYSGTSAAAAARNFLAAVTASGSAASYDPAVVTAVQGLLSAVAASYQGNYCGVTTGSYPGTVSLTLSGSAGSYSVTGTVNAAGTSIPVSGSTQPPVFNVELICANGGSTYVCGTVLGNITPTAITGNYSTADGGSGQLSLSRSCP